MNSIPLPIYLLTIVGLLFLFWVAKSDMQANHEAERDELRGCILELEWTVEEARDIASEFDTEYWEDHQSGFRQIRDLDSEPIECLGVY